MSHINQSQRHTPCMYFWAYGYLRLWTKRTYTYIYAYRYPCMKRPLCNYMSYGVATISRLLKIIGLFCRISSLL